MIIIFSNYWPKNQRSAILTVKFQGTVFELYFFKQVTKIIKKIKLLGFILIILLAVFGVSLTGGIPLPPKRRETKKEMKSELPEQEAKHSRSNVLR